MPVSKERVGSQLLKQQAAKTVGLTFPREAFKCFWEALGYRGVEQVGGNSKEDNWFQTFFSKWWGEESRVQRWAKDRLGLLRKKTYLNPLLIFKWLIGSIF